MMQMMKLPILSLLLVAIMSATTYTVKSAGGGDFTTIQACATAMAAGDTCTVYAGTYNETVTLSAGTAGNYKTINVNGSDMVVVRGFIAASYSKIIGFHIQFPSSTGSGCVSIPNGTQYLYIRNNVITECRVSGQTMINISYPNTASHVFIQGNTLSYGGVLSGVGVNTTLASGFSSGASTITVASVGAAQNGWTVYGTGIDISGGTFISGISGSVVTLTRTTTATGTNGEAISFYPPVSDSIYATGDHWLVEGNDFSHYTLGVLFLTQYGIFRNNTFHDQHQYEAGGNTHTDTFFSEPGVSVNVKYNVMEGNTQTNATGPDAKGMLSQGETCGGTCSVLIERFNVASRIGGGLVSNNTAWDAVKVYNNTWVDSLAESAFGNGNATTNNSTPFSISFATPRSSYLNDIYYYTATAAQTGFVNPYECSTTNSSSCTWGYNLAYCLGGCGTVYGHLYQTGTFASETGQQIANPLFVSYVSPGSSSNDYHLQSGSPALGAGTSLTTVASGDSGSGTSLIVNDASYFQDGYGLTNDYSTVSPDCIAVGTAANHVCITAVNYATNTLTLASSIARSSAQGVYLYSKSDGVQVLTRSAPNVGAFDIPPPVCDAGSQQTFKVGVSGTLDGSGSHGGTSLTYLWIKLSGPTGTFTGTTTVTPTFTASAFGTPVFQLTVTDTLAQSTSCTVKDGAVVVNANDVVQTGNASVDALIGPQIRWGGNPWPWYDNRHKAAADVQRGNFNVYYSDYWNTAATGTVTVFAGSSVVVGSGTSFKASFCGGGTVGVGKAIIIWYPRTSGTGRRQQSVVACADNTHLTLDAPYNADVSAGSGLSFSICTFTEAWDYHPAPANYYDNATAYYSLYYRSGIDDYLMAAREMADRYYQSPEFDAGIACHLTGYPLNCFFGAFISRVTLGIVLRALDGKPEYWDALKYLWELDHFYIHDYYPVQHYPGAIPDARSNGYLLMELGYCGMLAATNTGAADPTTRAACNADLTQSLTDLWTPSLQTSGDHPTFYGAYRTWDHGTSATMTNGSSVAVGVGTPFTSSMFSDCASGPEVGCAVWFYDAPAATIPAPVGGGDIKVYFGTYTDSSHITLHDIDGNVITYTGTSGTHGFVVADPNAGQFVGFGNQPYAAGLLAGGFAMAGKALRSANPVDPNAALFESYVIGQANWELTSGTNQQGTYAFSSPAMCRPPMFVAIYNCYNGPNDAGSRVQSAEVLRGVINAYALNGDSALKTLADGLFSGMWAKPGFIPTNTAGPAPDGTYIDAMNDNGFYMQPSPPNQPPPIGQAPKYYGQFFGISFLPSWAGVRLSFGSTGHSGIKGKVKARGKTVVR